MRYLICLASLCAVVLLAAGCATTVPDVGQRIHLAKPFDEPGLTRMDDPQEERDVFMYPAPVLTNEDIISAHALETPVLAPTTTEIEGRSVKVMTVVRRPAVVFRITRSARNRINDMMEEKNARRLVIVRDGESLAVAAIKTEVERDVLIVSNFTREEAQELANFLAGRTRPEGGAWRYGP